jgi:hypothetical protein
MKKIFLLSVIFLLAFSVSAQNSRYVYENQQAKSSQVLGILTESDNFISNISVYPNPVADVLKISFKSSRSSKAMISLFNNIGKQVYSQESNVEPGNNLFTIDVRSKSIESGIYFVQIIAEKEVLTKKVIIK